MRERISQANSLAHARFTQQKRIEPFQLFLSCAAHSLYTEWRESTPHTQTLLPNTRLARPACYTMATFSLRVLSACYCCLPLGVGSKASGWKRGRQGRRRRRQGAGGSAMPRCVPMFVRGGRCTPRIRPGGGEESEGDGGGRDRGSGGAQGWWRPPRAGCSRRGEVAGGRDRCALLECARQSSSDAAMVTCVRGDGKGRGSPCSPGAQS